MGLDLWGNTPAVDVIRFENNEIKDGSDYNEKISLAFVASGDFRSVVETLASVPHDYAGSIEIVINDRMPLVVARNLLMVGLLLLLGDKAIDAVISVWYSAALPLNQYMGPIYEVMQRFASVDCGRNQKLQFGGSTMEFRGLAGPMRILAEMCQNPVDIQEALKLRNAVMLNPSRRDYLDRHLLGYKSFHKESHNQFRAHGLMLPYECLNAHHNMPNMFLFSAQHGWMLNDSTDPTEGWDMKEVMKFGDQIKLPSNDLYGRLFFYVRDRLSKMVATIRRVPTTIRFFEKDASDLAGEFEKEQLCFDRIDVSNICDENYVGVERVLNDWGPLLNKNNPNSAIISLFINWFHLNEMVVPGMHSPYPPAVYQKGISPDERAMALLGIGTGFQTNVPVTLAKATYLLQNATHLLTDNSAMFNIYLGFFLKSKPSFLKRRKKHTIVPHRVMFPLDAEPGTTVECLSEEEQHILLNWSVNRMTRYAEWVLG